MKKESRKSTAVKIATWSIVVALLAGILAVSGLADSAGGGIATKIFIAAAAAVIALQIVPGLVLLAAMFKGIYSVVDNRELLIADKDPRYCKQLADHFRKDGYHVETADSPEQLLNTVMNMQAPVLLLGNDFSLKLSSSDLIHLFKKCNRNLHIIMVSDEMSLAQARQVREEGIFFHALKPATPADTEELAQVVACAFKHQASAHGNRASVQQKRAAVAEGAEKTGWEGRPLVKALPWLGLIVAAIVGLNHAAVANAVSTFFHGTSLATWIFLGFAGLIVTYQMLPIFRVKLGLSKYFVSQGAKEDGGRGSK